MPSINPTKRVENWPLNAMLALLMLALLIAGCTTAPAPLQPKPVKPVRLPALDHPPPKPSICSPDCLTAWREEQQRLLNTLTPQRPTPAIAEAHTTKPEKP